MKIIHGSYLIVLTLFLCACIGGQPVSPQPAPTTQTSKPSAPTSTQLLTSTPTLTLEATLVTIEPPYIIPSREPELAPGIQEETILPKTVQTHPTDWSLISVNFHEGSFILDLSVSPDGVIWLATSDGVWRLNGQSWKLFTSQDGLPANTGFMGIAVNSQGDVVVAACHGGIYRFEDEKWILFTNDTPLLFQQICGQGLYLQDDGHFWMGIANPEIGYIPGLGAIYFDSQRWHIYFPDRIDLNGIKTEKAAIPFTDVINIVPGLDSKVWFETNAGISSYDGIEWINYSSTDITGVSPILGENAIHKLSGLTGLVVASDGTVWVGTENGVARLNNSIWTNYKLPSTISAIKNTRIVPLAAGSDGSVWFHIPGHLLRFDGNSWWQYSLPPEFELSFWWLAAVGPDKALWLGSQNVVVRYLPGGTPIEVEMSLPIH